MRGEKAYITPDVLRWARETAKLSVDEMARKMKVTDDKIIAWETGEKYPTIRQLDDFARHYRRPTAVFYLPEPPEDFHTLRDFRRSDRQKEYSTALTFFIRDIQGKQQWLSDMLQQDGEAPIDFVGKFSPRDNIKMVARDIRERIGISATGANKEPLREWVKRVESTGVLVSHTNGVNNASPIDKEEAKGFAINDAYAPYIFVNSRDYKNSQLFTLIHEFVHIWIGETGVSDFQPIDFREDASKFDDREIYCNKVAAEVLMPEETVHEKISGHHITVSTIEKLSKKFGVSSFSMMVRLVNTGIIETNQYGHYYSILNKKFQDYIDKEAEKDKPAGTPNFYLLQLKRNSRLFTHQIYSFYKEGRLNGSEASDLLNIKVNGFKKLEEQLYKMRSL